MQLYYCFRTIKCVSLDLLSSTVCLQALEHAISLLKPNVSTHTISSAIQKHVERNGFYLLRDFTGHGCGNQIHEDPPIPNYRSLFPRWQITKKYGDLYRTNDSC